MYDRISKAVFIALFCLLLCLCGAARSYAEDRTVTVGDLPADHDPSLVLRKGRTITIMLREIDSEISSEDAFVSWTREKGFRDDSGKNILILGNVPIFYWYRISEEDNKIKINITATSIDIDWYNNIYVLFSNPPQVIIGRWRDGDGKRRAHIEESLPLREQLFLSPVISAELVLGPESEDRASERGKIIFGENASGDRTVSIESGYIVELEVKKDILFSGPWRPSSIPQGRYRVETNIDDPNIFISGDRIFIADITMDGNIKVFYSKSLQFRALKYISQELLGGGGPFKHYRSSRFVGGEHSGSVNALWLQLYDELSGASDPERFKIPYAFAFDLTPEEHALCDAQPDEILNIIQGKEAILTWISQEIQWSDKLRIRYLRDYIAILKENGYTDWAETIENLEGKSYLYDDE